MNNRDYRILTLITDGYGSTGGISRFNRDFIAALCSYSKTTKLITFPRLIRENIIDEMPPNLTYVITGTNGKLNYIINLFKYLLKNKNYQLIICGHINLLPIAWLTSKITNAPLALIIHGIDAWQPTKSKITNRLVQKVDKLICVSALTVKRFCAWSKFPKERAFILPNCVELENFSPGTKDSKLLDKYNIHDKKVLLTLGRLESFERKKGFDEVIDALPFLLEVEPQIVYIIAGDGPDKQRLKQKAIQLGVTDHVVFTGFVDEQEKASLYRLADAFIMPSQGEGFGIVLLEAMASGIPVMASKLDGSSEALKQGELGKLVNPQDLNEVKAGILETLTKPKLVPSGLSYFSRENFTLRVHELLSSLLN